MRKILTLAMLTGVAMTVAAVMNGASAHARLTSASPAVGSTIHAAPAEVTINYSEGVEPKFCTVEVQDSAGARVDSGEIHTATGNPKQLLVGLKPVGPGTYKVIWHATSVDTHKTEGSFVFTVAP